MILKIHLLLLILVSAFIIVSFHCSSSNSISDIEKSKLDRPLVRLLAGEPIDKNLIHETIRTDGTKAYAVIVRSDQPEEIQALGIVVTSVLGDVVVVHATIEEIKKIASLPSVRALEAGSKKTTQPHQ